MIVIDEDNGYVALQGLSNRSPLSKIERRRRDSLVLPVQFLKGGRTRELASGSTGVLGIKELGAFSGSFFAVDHEWHQEGSGQNAIYYFIADLNSTEIEAKFTTDSVKEIKLAIELRWFENNRPFSATNDIDLVVKNRYIQGDEDPVVSANDLHATQAQAEAGVITSVWMSPLRVFQAIAAYITAQAASVRAALGMPDPDDILTKSGNLEGIEFPDQAREYLGIGEAALIRRVSVPEASDSAGARGDFAVTTTHLYIYTGNGFSQHRWLRIAGANEF